MILTAAAIAAAVFFAFAQYWGLVIAPPDRMMGDVYRILFVHVPAAWCSMVLFTLSFVGSLLFLLRRKPVWDRLAHAAVEVGVVTTILTLALGSIWGRPAWGVWWTWDPRLTTTALLLILYAGYLMLRRLAEDPARGGRIAATVGILIYLNVPIVYFSVKWWRSLHQVQSTPKTMSPEMFTPLRLNALSLLAVCLIFLVIRIRLARRQAVLEERESAPPGPPAAPTPGVQPKGGRP